MAEARSRDTETPSRTVAEQIQDALITPVRAMRLRYLPLLMVYFAYGALGLTAVAQSFWVKSELTMTPADLASLGVWLTVPWTVKMVFGQFVDSIPLLGSRRRVYVFIGAGLVAMRPDDPGRRGGRMACLRAARHDVCHRLAHDHHGRGAAGRGGRRHEHRGGAARGGGRDAQAERGGRARTRPGPGARAACAVLRHLFDRGDRRLARPGHLLRDRVPGRPRRAGDLGIGRSPGDG